MARAASVISQEGGCTRAEGLEKVMLTTGKFSKAWHELLLPTFDWEERTICSVPC